MKTIGIDVGGIKKGFHAVANQHGAFFAKFHSSDVNEMVLWISKQQPSVVAIDAPCMFSMDDYSREAERLLVSNGVRCFFTPTREHAQKSRFYDWVFNGERLFKKLNLPLFMGKKAKTPCVIETFPHGINLFFRRCNHLMPSEKSKILARKLTLKELANYPTSELTNIDFVDAALCAIAADYFFRDQFIAYGSNSEGYIVLPNKP